MSTSKADYVVRLIDVLIGISAVLWVAIAATGGFSLLGFSLYHTSNSREFIFELLALRIIIRSPRWIPTSCRWLAANWHVALLALAVFAIALVPRVLDLSGNSLNSDELLWIKRGRSMVEALRSDRPIEATANLGHPGIIQAFLIGQSYNCLGVGTSEYSLELLDPIPAARLPIALLGALTCPLLFLLARRISSTQTALFAGLLLAAEAVHIGLSRLAHLDAVLCLFFMLTVLAYGIAELEGRRRWKAAAGILFGCALLAKATGFILPVVLLLWKVVAWARARERRRALISVDDVLCLLLGYGVYVLFFTRLWLDPTTQSFFKPPEGISLHAAVHGLGSGLRRFHVMEVVLPAFALTRWLTWRRGGESRDLRDLFALRSPGWAWAGVALLLLMLLRLFPWPVENTAMLLGKYSKFGLTHVEVASDSGLRVWGWYHTSRMLYPFLIVIRSSVFLLLFLVVGLGVAAWRFVMDRQRAAAVALQVVTAVAVLAFMSSSKRMAIRYVLSIYPFICLIAGTGLAATVEGALCVLNARRTRVRRSFACAACTALLLGTHLPALILYFPNYFLFYNALVGGPAGAKNRVIVGWGEGHQETVAALKEIVGDRPANISALAENSLLRYYWKFGQPPSKADVHIGSRVFEEADYVVVILYKSQMYPQEAARVTRGRAPIRVVHLNGLDIAWIYPHERKVITADRYYDALDPSLDVGTGRRDDDEETDGKPTIAATVANDSEGWLVRGPYRTYGPGDYIAAFHLRAGPPSAPGPVALVAVLGSPGKKVVAERKLRARDLHQRGEYASVSLPFSLEEEKTLEFRVYFCDRADLWFHHVEVDALAPDESWVKEP